MNDTEKKWTYENMIDYKNVYKSIFFHVWGVYDAVFLLYMSI